eukprot:7383880-Prymnesium_polylepis.1
MPRVPYIKNLNVSSGHSGGYLRKIVKQPNTVDGERFCVDNPHYGLIALILRYLCVGLVMMIRRRNYAKSFTLQTEAVSARVVLCEGVFVAESDDISREESTKGDAPLVRVGRNDSFLLQILSCGQNLQTASVPAFVQRGDVWSLLWNPLLM